MSERLTAISLPGYFGSGLADWGRKTPSEMIKMIREKAAEDKAVAEAILAAADDDFHIDTYIGVHKIRDRVVLQKGRATTSSAPIRRIGREDRG